MKFQHLKVEVEGEGRLWNLTFHHGKANEVGREVLVELERLAVALEEDPQVVALVTTSRRTSAKGTPIFISGADVAERSGWPEAQVKEHVRWQREVLGRLRRAPVFHCVVVGGLALGWGTEFLLTADWRIATAEATFGLPETGLGIVPGAGGTSELWTEVGVGQALRLGMTGERIGAEEAARIGLVHELAATLEAGCVRARQLAERVARNSPTAVAAFKAGVLDAVGLPAAARAEREALAYATCVDTGQAAIGRASFEEIRAGRTPSWGPRSKA